MRSSQTTCSRVQGLAKLQPHSETQNNARARILPVAERKERLLGWAKVQGEGREKWYLNGHAGGLSTTFNDQQEAPILLILLWLQLEHRHLS